MYNHRGNKLYVYKIVYIKSRYKADSGMVSSESWIRMTMLSSNADCGSD